MNTGGKFRSFETGGSNPSRGMRDRVDCFGLGLDKFLEVSGRNAKSGSSFRDCGGSLGVSAIRNWVTWAAIAGGLTCVGCSSVAWL